MGLLYITVWMIYGLGLRVWGAKETTHPKPASLDALRLNAILTPKNPEKISNFHSLI